MGGNNPSPPRSRTSFTCLCRCSTPHLSLPRSPPPPPCCPTSPSWLCLWASRSSPAGVVSHPTGAATRAEEAYGGHSSSMPTCRQRRSCAQAREHHWGHRRNHVARDQGAAMEGRTGRGLPGLRVPPRGSPLDGAAQEACHAALPQPLWLPCR
jgi:hypothetical protein